MIGPSDAPSFSSTPFQNLPSVSDLLPEVSQFQHHKKAGLQM